MKKHLSVMLFVTVCTTACSNTSVMSDNNYQSLSNISGGLKRCFELKKISTKLYVDTTKSLSYSLSTLKYDPIKLSAMQAQAYSATTVKNCRQVEASAYSFNASVAERKQQQEDSIDVLYDAMEERNKNKVISCAKIFSSKQCY